MVSTDEICFAAETTLGKLAKWLRILGFDTLSQGNRSVERFIASLEMNRIILTRTKRVQDMKLDRKLIFIHSNEPSEQIKEVIQTLDILPENIRPFSRCIRCNVLIEQVNKDAVRSRVPDYVWETHAVFQICCRCQRIYWPGSHTQRSHDIIKQFFEA
jgi:uncharacterized protein with PIN domain